MLLAFLATAAPALADGFPSETERLVSTSRLWFTVKYFSPALAYRAIDWDQALVNALPKIRAAQTSGEYESAVRSMMHILEGGATEHGAGQRLWIHHGLEPETGTDATPFYSAFLYRSGDAVEDVSVPMGGFSVKVPLSENVSGTAAIPAPPAGSRYSDAAYPSTELRILAAYKIWGILHYFFAYRDLIDEDWDSLLPQFLPRLIAAKNALEYNLAVAEWLTHAADSFTTAESLPLKQYFGPATVGLGVRIVEKYVTVTEVLDPEATKAGIKIGDIVKKVDGETLVDKFKRESQYVPASTPQRQGMEVVQRLLNGSDGSNAQLTIEDPAGNRKEVALKRRTKFAEAVPSQNAGDVVRVLRGGIGYADLTRLKMAEVNAMFEKFAHAPAIIFDMRGVPADDSFQVIAAHLTKEPDTAAAIVTGPVVLTPDLPREETAGASSSYFFLRTIGHRAEKPFAGKTVMLVDERTIDAGELAGLYLEAAHRTEFVGTPTAGACSVLSNFAVPGGITITFSGEDIRHSNGGKLQRLGLQPNINVAPSLVGIRAGKDEVLEKAVESLLPAMQRPLPKRAANAILGL